MHDLTTFPAGSRRVAPSPGSATAKRKDQGREPPSARPGGGDALIATTAAVIGMGTAWSLYPRGGLTLGHAVLAIISPVVLAAAWRWRTGRACLAFVALWLGAAGVTEVVTEDSMRDAAYALSRPLTVGLSFCGALWIFEHGWTATRVYVVSLVTGLFAAVAFTPWSANTAVDPWKYGYGALVSVAVVLLSAALFGRGRSVVAVLLIAATCVVNLVLGFRSEFLVVSVTAAMGLLAARHTERKSWKRVVMVGASLCGIVSAVYVGYGHLAANGHLDAEQEMKWARQSGVHGGLLVGGRPEIAASVVIIQDSPLMGRGIASEVDSDLRVAFLDRLRTVGVSPHEGHVSYYFGRGLYVHSVLFQLWAETGILVLPGLLTPLFLVLSALVVAIRNGAGPPVLVFSLLSARLGWDLMFSPWPRLHGILLGTAAAAAVVYLSRHRRAMQHRTVEAPGGTP